MVTAEQAQRKLRDLGDSETARFLEGYFKAVPGGYGEGDRFLGIRMPVLRRLARKFRSLSVADITRLLISDLHEERMLALLLLVQAYARADAMGREQIYHAYLEHTRFIDNWDLVDVSAQHIVGPHLWQGDRSPLEDLARSALVWERRISIMATFHYIKRGEFETSLQIAELLLRDPHDLIHKAVGWMLREVGKRDPSVEEAFLRERYQDMPRTMLRYAIERFPEPLRQQYLKGNV